jgi:hypothetical protein
LEKWVKVLFDDFWDLRENTYECLLININDFPIKRIMVSVYVNICMCD